jgi:uncharacterized protein with PIN domain
VAVPCPGCGREYDVALFQFGRTIWCACGRRVGLEPRVRSGAGLGEPRFFADAMLGRLARWLRILGFDTAYEDHIPDAVLVRRAQREARTILTRDRALPDEWRVTGIYIVREAATAEQLREVVDAFRLAPALRPFTRCSRCNARLIDASPERVRSRVPARVLERHDEFRVCEACDRVYWAGSHTERMRRVVERLVDPAGAE